ncbi:MAG: AAA family ATPase [Marinifilaceae bacterium]|jgi:exodeoxyribonuclease-5|nr:AAA family ATPase [Marinifilaceae bacterium]
MLNDFLSDLVRKELVFDPTDDQNSAIDCITSYISISDEDAIVLLKGYAGTGKTSLIGAVIKSLHKLKIKTMLMAPTGRAAKVLSNYSGFAAYTIHKKIYRQKSLNTTNEEFNIDKNLHKDTVFIIDESSMISNSTGDNSVFGTGRLLDDLVNYVTDGENCKLIMVGDTAQLPPVGLDVSPALDTDELVSLYNFQIQERELTEVIRQSMDSGIHINATHLRELISYQSNEFPKFQIKDYDDIERVSGMDLIDKITESYDNYGMEETIIITRNNKRANQFNQGVRNTILYREEEISNGDILMVVKNNYFWSKNIKELDFIANGDIMEVKRIRKYHNLYGYRFVEATVCFPDYNYIEADTVLMLDTLNMESANLPYDKYKEFFYSVLEDYSEYRSKKEKFERVRNNEYFNALQVKFAYAITCHKAQGGQWDNVFIDQGYVTREYMNNDYYRWLYTALTRAKKKVYLVNFSDDFFTD